MEQRSFSRERGALVAGFILLAVGLVFLLDNFDVIYLGVPAARFWPLIVIAIGVVKFTQAENSCERRRGFFWTMIGLWLLVSVLPMFGLTFHNSWPLLLIGLGINSIWKSVTPQTEWRTSKG